MMTAFATNPAPPGAAAPAEIPCPMCDYNLHGLTAPRCPECGYAFDWADLLDPTRRKHKYLFEHHPERNVWSFCRTAVGGLVPWRFWRSLRPEQPSNLRRLILYWLITAMGVLLMFVVIFALMCMLEASQNAVNRTAAAAFLKSRPMPEVIRDFGSVEAYLDSYAPAPPSRAFFKQTWQRFLHDDSIGCITLLAVISFFTWPWVTAASLLLFQQSMRQARVRRTHVLRCCLYSFDVGLWFTLVLIAGFIAATWDLQTHPTSLRAFFALLRTLLVAAAALMIFGGARLLIAYRLYMRFPHAAAVVVLALLVAALLTLTVIINVPGMEMPLVDAWHWL